MTTQPAPNPARLAPLFNSVWYCLRCQKPTANYHKCQKCHAPAVLKLFAMIPVGGPYEPGEKQKKDYKLMDTITTARQMRLGVIRDFLANKQITEEEALASLAGPLEPGNLATIVDDSSLLNDPDAYAKIASPPDPPVLLLRSQIFEIIRAVRAAMGETVPIDHWTGSRLLDTLEPLAPHDHIPAQLASHLTNDTTIGFFCAVCHAFIKAE